MVANIDLKMRIHIVKRLALTVLAVALVTIVISYVSRSQSDSMPLAKRNTYPDMKLVEEKNRVKLENIRLKNELRKYRSQIMEDGGYSFNNTLTCEVIHVCIVCAGYDAARDVTTVIKSLLFHRSNVLHLHLMVDSVSLPILTTLLKTWAIPSVLYSFYSTDLIINEVSWIPNTHYTGIYGLLKLQLPYVLPASVDKLIVLETDVVLTTDILGLWNLFSVFQPTQILGLVENLSDWYITTKFLTWPAVDRGFNTGVMMMHLQRMRDSSWDKLWSHTTHKYLPDFKKVKLAEQDIINAVIKDSDGLIVYKLPCAWNVQITLKSSFDASCYSTASAKLLHFNSHFKLGVLFGSQHKNSVADSFKNVYFMFTQYDGNLLKHKSLSSTCGQWKSNTFSSSVIGDLMKSNPEASLACSQVQGLRQSSQGRLHLYYIAYNYTVKPGDITLVAQLGIDRIGVLELLCTHWPGPMSIALYLSDSHAQQFYEFVGQSLIISKRSNIGFHVVFKTGTHYPVNYLRNVALNNAPTEYVFLTDVDFVPMTNLYSYLKDFSKLNSVHGNKIALVVAAFETQQYKLKMPTSKRQLKQHVDMGHVQIFRNEIWDAGQESTNYSNWFQTDEPYGVSWQPNYEPCIMVSREMVPKYDERFFGFGWDRVSHIMEVDAQGFKMIVLPNAFIIRSPQAPSLAVSQYRSNSVYRQCLETLKKDFLKDLSTNYGEQAQKYLTTV